MKLSVKKYFDQLLQTYPALKPCQSDIIAAFNLLAACYRNKGKVLACGNGGSAADAEHIVGELMKGFILKRPVNASERQKIMALHPGDGAFLADNLQRALPAISLTSHTALITAYANDVHADMIFAQQVFGFGKPGDCLIGLSTSGNSANVLNALKVANSFGLQTLGMTGEGGGKLKGLCDVTICAPARAAAGVQEFHLPVYHTLCCMVEE
ncbi:MAG: SIS domain-containing protein, partial [Chitinivibrionales bacterium]|nr:SIS domain-containing protein [Chitinivibrionales bacterium]